MGIALYARLVYKIQRLQPNKALRALLKSKAVCEWCFD